MENRLFVCFFLLMISQFCCLSALARTTDSEVYYAKPFSPLSFSLNLNENSIDNLQSDTALSFKVLANNFTPLTLRVILGNGAQYAISLPSKARGKVEVPLFSEPLKLGLRQYPTKRGTYTARQESSGSPETTKVLKAPVKVFVDGSCKAYRLQLKGIHVKPITVKNDSLIVDQFGQPAGKSIFNRVRHEKELVRRKNKEIQKLKSDSFGPAMDKFGGWKLGPQLEKTGYFRLKKVNGKWWFVTPSGHLFYSSGVNCIRLSETSFTDGRYHLFPWIDQAKKVSFNHVSFTDIVIGEDKEEKQEAFNVFSANLEKKYGDDYKSEWFKLAAQRLKHWRLNTIGAWSDQEFIESAMIPYVIALHVEDEGARIYRYGGTTSILDPFDKNFGSVVASVIRHGVAQRSKDSYLIGYFFGNEVPWPDAERGDLLWRLSYELLTSDKNLGTASRNALLVQLKQKYSSITELNKSWSSNLESWDSLKSKVFSFESDINKSMKDDLSDFSGVLISRYYRGIARELKAQDPNHLFLGSRLTTRDEKVLSLIAPHCDLLSFNCYKPLVYYGEWSVLSRLDKPALLSEYHITTYHTSPHLPGLVATSSKRKQIKQLKQFINSAIANDYITGCHWFQFVDQPSTGRTIDGENFSIGLVDITDTPKHYLVHSIKKINKSLYFRRFNQVLSPFY